MENTHAQWPINTDFQSLIDTYNALSEATKETISMMKYPRIYMLLRRHSRIAMMTARHLREGLNIRDAQEDILPLMQKMSTDIRCVRDNLSKLVDLSEKHTVFILERKSILEAFEAWDDLLDDCTIFTDPKIRAALLKRADEASTMEPSKDWRTELYDM